MAHQSADRVYDTSTTTGTGAVSVTGTAPSGYRTFSAVMSVGDTCWYSIANQAAAEWEAGLATYSASNTLTRTTVLASSNSGSAVSFSAGTKDVFMTLLASKTIQRDVSGNVYSASGGGSDSVFYLNAKTVTASYSIPSGQYAQSLGPITINSGVTVTVPSGSKWVVR